MEQLKGNGALATRSTGADNILMPSASPTNNLIRVPILSVLRASYESNQINGIRCMNDSGEEVAISVDKNTMLIVHDKKGETAKFYLDTTYLENNKIKGLRSRLLGITNEVDLDNIETLEVYSEFTRERK